MESGVEEAKGEDFEAVGARHGAKEMVGVKAINTN